MVDRAKEFKDLSICHQYFSSVFVSEDPSSILAKNKNCSKLANIYSDSTGRPTGMCIFNQVARTSVLLLLPPPIIIPQTKFLEGNVFSRVCLSLHGRRLG